MNIEFEKAAGSLNAEQMDFLARSMVAELEGRRGGRYAGLSEGEQEARAERAEAAEGYREELRQVRETLERIVNIQSAGLKAEPEALAREKLAELGALGVQTRWREGLSGAKGYRVYAEDGGEEPEGSETVYRSFSSVTNRETLDAGRISDYFKRDSRRYDGGFERF